MRFRKLVGAVFLLREDGAILLQHRDNKPGIPYADYWSIPSGRKVGKESMRKCAERELFEETGYRCCTLKPLTLVRDRDDVDEEYELAIFWEKYDGRQPLECREGQELRFIHRSEATNYKTPPFLLKIWGLL